MAPSMPETDRGLHTWTFAMCYNISCLSLCGTGHPSFSSFTVSGQRAAMASDDGPQYDKEKNVYSTQTVDSVSEIASYEDAAVTQGAPTEKISPLGYHVDWISVIFLNVSKMVGTGVFTTPGSILKGVGSVGLSFIFWVIGYLFAGASLAVYLEYASYFPHRSGAEVAYLEKAYPRPAFLIPTTFAVQSVLLSFSSSNAIVLAKYLLVAGGHEITAWNTRGLAVGVFTGIVAICIISTKWSLRLSNAIGVVKVLTLVFISITGLVVLGGHTKVEDPKANFRNSFGGTTSNGNGLATALVKVNFAYAGFENSFSLLNEVKNPVKTMKRYAPLSLTVVFILYMFANVAYFAAISKEEIRKSKELTASLFFVAVFGNHKAVSALSALVAVSSFGNLLAVVIGSSRVIRECGRQGVLPYPRFWASTRPFNTPLGPYLLKWVLTVIVIIAPPAGDAFNFIVDLQSYPANVFSFLVTFGLFSVRKRRANIGAPPTEFRAWNFVLIFSILVNIYLLVLPWVPPAGGIYAGDVSFFYATYCIVGLAILAVSGIFYAFFIILLPKWRNYTIRQFLEKLPDGAQATRLVKVPNADLADRRDTLPDTDFDFIIVGGGTAGSVLANRLTENPSFQVLVIEAGPNNEGVLNSIVPGFAFNLGNSAFDWNFTTVPQNGVNGRTIMFERGHGLGGSSSVNGMVYTRGSSSDYDRFAQVTGDPGWSWNALQPYVKKHEGFTVPVDNHSTVGQFDPSVHGFNGPILTTLPGLLNPSIDIRVITAAQQLRGDFAFNLDMNSGNPLGVGWEQSTTGHGVRSSAATGYLASQFRARPNLHILVETRVTRILKSSGSGMSFRTVELSNGTSSSSPRTTLTATKEVILSAGSIGTPHILLHSGIGSKSDLKAVGISSVLDLPGVGQNLTDHPLFSVGFDLDIRDDADPWGDLFVNSTLQAEAFQLWNTSRTGPDAFFGRLDQIAWVRIPSNSSVFANTPDTSSGPNSAHYELALAGSATSISSGSSVVSPASRGSVTLKTSNPFDAPLIDPGYFSADVDLAIARESVRGFFRFIAAPIWKSVLVGPTAPLINNAPDALLNEIIRNTTSSGAHPIGTASMSPLNAPWGVVDPNLLLKHASGLRVVDASVLPFVPCAHTQAAIYIISERAADIIKAAHA
ncbi:hypothetical protein D9619_004475 [Psilocybe cf. subviscida]|uniref:pyranose dehydrogenase (acceptor) n=1 Tax=Psilocybe cf. subviscida TaxID=2480587 RepID=A0A8H5BPE7_9AGAR|nr:hypothetical protein D9619_004475 [Psilocybe cf. subviscida]